MSDKINRGGAPAGNQNSLRRGLYSKVFPTHMVHLIEPLKAWERRLQVEVVRWHNSPLTPEQNSLIDVAIAHTKHAATCNEIFCDPDATITERLAASKGVPDALERRIKIIDKLFPQNGADDDEFRIPIFDSPVTPAPSPAVPTSPAVDPSPQIPDSVEGSVE